LPSNGSAPWQSWTNLEARALPTEPFAHSLGVHSGTPVAVEIEFDARVAEYVKGREWHRSQVIDERPDGSLLMTLTVSDDRPLRSWIHSFGPLARVVSPARLAQEIFEEIDEARDRYKARLTFDIPRAAIKPAEGPAPAVEARKRRLPLKTRKWRAS
jgi:WYL domain